MLMAALNDKTWKAFAKQETSLYGTMQHGNFAVSTGQLLSMHFSNESSPPTRKPPNSRSVPKRLSLLNKAVLQHKANFLSAKLKPKPHKGTYLV